MNDPNTLELRSNVINFPAANLNWIEQPVVTTPVTDEMEEKAEKLNLLSAYRSDFDWKPFRDLERRLGNKPVRGGLAFKSPFKLVNSHSTCQQCLYAFEVDTYGRGCVHNCVYCYAKAELTVHGY